MEIKLFGKSLFKYRSSKSEALWVEVNSERKKSKYLPDFHDLDGRGANTFNPSDYVIVTTDEAGNGVAVPKGKLGKKAPKQKAKVDYKITPKGVYEMEMLNDKKFELNADPVYVEKQIADFKEKLSLVKSEEYDMNRGVLEISSVLARLENRLKYADNKEFFEQFPYTTTSKVGEMVKMHDHLKLGQSAQFVADLPKEAVQVMKDYNQATDKLCGKQAVFYIIAEKKDFEKSHSRRDPILLAQSPFAHCWQILGAWDKEMMLLEEL